MSEFNVDLGIELPSLSVGLTDYVTLITDGSEFGFSIGIPVFKAEKSTTAYTASDKRLNPLPNRPLTANGSAAARSKKMQVTSPKLRTPLPIRAS